MERSEFFDSIVREFRGDGLTEAEQGRVTKAKSSIMDALNSMAEHFIKQANDNGLIVKAYPLKDLRGSAQSAVLYVQLGGKMGSAWARITIFDTNDIGIVIPDGMARRLQVEPYSKMHDQQEADRFLLSVYTKRNVMANRASQAQK